MSYYQKFKTTATGLKWAIFLTAGFFTLSGMSLDRVSFSGEWKLNESKSKMGGNFPLCIFGGDRMRSKTMKITSHADFLTLDVASSSPDGALVTRQEKLVFDGKLNKATYVGMAREQSSASWSNDGQTMTVRSVRSFDKNGKTPDFTVTEVWNLIDGGKSIVIQVNEQSVSGAHTMTLVYDKQLAADYRF
ncbi:MAG: hypothetical protein ACTHLE_13400 [Agriterribacter sp.]